MVTSGDIASTVLAQAVEIAIAEGNTILDVSTTWDPKQVVFMKEPLSPEARAEILASFPSLDRVVSPRTPHNPADEMLVSRADDVVVSFPIEDVIGCTPSYRK